MSLPWTEWKPRNLRVNWKKNENDLKASSTTDEYVGGDPSAMTQIKSSIVDYDTGLIREGLVHDGRLKPSVSPFHGSDIIPPQIPEGGWNERPSIDPDRDDSLYVPDTSRNGTWRTLQPGRCFNLTGTEYARFDNIGWAASLPFSMCGWGLFDKATTADYGSFLSISTIVDGLGYYNVCVRSATGFVSVVRRNDTLLNTVKQMTDFDLSNRWFHWAVSFDSEDYQRFWVDGALTFDGSVTPGTPRANSDSIGMGVGRLNSPAWYLTGKVHDSRVYSRAFTNDEVMRIAKTGDIVDPSSLVFWDKCESTDPTLSWDSSGNGAVGKKINFVPPTNFYEGTDVPKSYQNDNGYSEGYDYNGTNQYHNIGKPYDLVSGSIEAHFRVKGDTTASAYSGLSYTPTNDVLYFGVQGGGIVKFLIGDQGVVVNGLVVGDGDVIKTRLRYDTNGTHFIDLWENGGWVEKNSVVSNGKGPSGDLDYYLGANNWGVNGIGQYCNWELYDVVFKDRNGDTTYDTKVNGFGTPTNAPTELFLPRDESTAGDWKDVVGNPLQYQGECPRDIRKRQSATPFWINSCYGIPGGGTGDLFMPADEGTLTVRFNRTGAFGSYFFAGSQRTGRCYYGIDGSGHLAAGIGADGWTVHVNEDVVTEQQVEYDGVMSYDGTTVRLYLDGVEIYSGSQNGAPDPGWPLFMCAHNNSSSGVGFYGNNVLTCAHGFYNRALTAEEVAELHRNPVPTGAVKDACIAFYPGSEGSGGTIHNVIADEKHAELQNLVESDQWGTKTDWHHYNHDYGWGYRERFDGVGDGFETDSVCTFVVPGTASISFVIEEAPFEGIRVVTGVGGFTGGLEVMLVDGLLRFYTGNGSTYLIATDVTPYVGQAIECSWDGSTRKITANGAVIASDATIPETNVSDQIQIGQHNDGGYQFNGRISNLKWVINGVTVLDEPRITLSNRVKNPDLNGSNPDAYGTAPDDWTGYSVAGGNQGCTASNGIVTVNAEFQSAAGYGGIEQEVMGKGLKNGRRYTLKARVRINSYTGDNLGLFLYTNTPWKSVLPLSEYRVGEWQSITYTWTQTTEPPTWLIFAGRVLLAGETQNFDIDRIEIIEAEVPALLDGSGVPDGSIVDNPAGLWHNNANTEYDFQQHANAPWHSHVWKGYVHVNGPQGINLDHLISQLSGLDALTVYVSARPTDTGNGRIFSTGIGTRYDLNLTRSASSRWPQAYDGAIIRDFGDLAVSGNEWHELVIRWNETTLSAWLDGTKSGSEYATTFDPSGIAQMGIFATYISAGNAPLLETDIGRIRIVGRDASPFDVLKGEAVFDWVFNDGVIEDISGNGSHLLNNEPSAIDPKAVIVPNDYTFNEGLDPEGWSRRYVDDDQEDKYSVVRNKF